MENVEDIINQLDNQIKQTVFLENEINQISDGHKLDHLLGDALKDYKILTENDDIKNLIPNYNIEILLSAFNKLDEIEEHISERKKFLQSIKKELEEAITKAKEATKVI